VRRVALADLLGSQAAWWWCILWVRADHPHVALVAPAAYVAAHLALRSSRLGRSSMLLRSSEG
jgi:hypothetical protein